MRLAVLAALCASQLACAGCRSLDDRLVYQPARFPEGRWVPPGLRFEDAWFDSADGTRLHGWYCPHSAPRDVVLVAHGNGGNLSYDWEMMRLLVDQLHVTAMSFDYRGYGRSEGKPTERGVLADAGAARGWLASKAGVSEPDIVLIGRSLGGGVMVDLTAADGARGLVLESTFTSLPDVAARVFPYVPVRALMRNRMDSLSKIASYRGPLLQSHGSADRLIPIELARQLHEAANEPKQFVTIAGADHNWAPTSDYLAQLDQFIAALPAAPSNAMTVSDNSPMNATAGVDRSLLRPILAATP